MILYVYETLRSSVADGNFYIIIGIAFLAGLVTSFTPCIYPMIPITVGILHSEAPTSLWKNFLSALCYVLGMTTIYSFLGYMAATGALIFGQWATSPWVIVFVVLFFLYLAFSMFGFYELYIPSFLTKQREISQNRSLLRNFLFGIISGSVASPCLTPPLAVLLTMVAKYKNPFLGISTLFAFSLGMGMLLLLIGTFSSSLALLPRAGRWMLEIKRFFGFMMLGMCAYFSRSLIGDTLVTYCYLGIGIIAFLYYIVTLVFYRYMVLKNNKDA